MKNNFNPTNLRLIDPDFYLGDTTSAAKELLGKVITRTQSDGSINYYRITETEAYLGITDPVCHSYKNRNTARTKPMYLVGGSVYIYIIYGLYLCLNVITKEEGVPEGVLIRALEPLSDEKSDPSGPGKIGRILELDRNMNGLTFFDSNSPLKIYTDPTFILKPSEILATPRIGVDRNNRYPLAKLAKLRFFIKNNPFVSKSPFNNSLD